MPAEERARHVVLLGPDGPRGRGAGIEGGWVGGGGGGRRRPEDVEQAFGESLRSRTFFLDAGVGFDEQLGGAVERRVLPYLRDDVLARNACVKATVVLRVEMAHERGEVSDWYRASPTYQLGRGSQLDGDEGFVLRAIREAYSSIEVFQSWRLVGVVSLELECAAVAGRLAGGSYVQLPRVIEGAQATVNVNLGPQGPGNRNGLSAGLFPRFRNSCFLFAVLAALHFDEKSKMPQRASHYLAHDGGELDMTGIAEPLTLHEGVPRFLRQNPGVSLNIHGCEEDGRLYTLLRGGRPALYAAAVPARGRAAAPREPAALQQWRRAPYCRCLRA